MGVQKQVGWLAHWRQLMLQKGGVKIWSVLTTVTTMIADADPRTASRRPRQLYVGEGERDYVSIEDRKQKAGAQDRDHPVPVEHTFSKRMLLSREAKL